jgi:hypothetical protein
MEEFNVSITNSPSDFQPTAEPKYSDGFGFYTDYKEVANLLQLPHFDTSNTYPTRAQVGSIIKRVEGIVDDKLKRSYRPIITKKEVHNFEYTNRPGMTLFGGYVGFIQLRMMKVQKIVSLQVWSGSGYKELASAQGSINLLENYRDMHSIILQLPNSGASFELVAESGVGTALGSDEFCTAYGKKTTASEIVSLVNEEFPSTHKYTKAFSPKALQDTGDSLDISDFFYAQKEEGKGSSVLISSLLSGDDGSECIIKATIKQSCTTANTDATLTVADSSKLSVGMVVSGTGIPTNATIASITNSTTLELSASATTSATNTLTFTTTDEIPSVCSLSSFTSSEDMKRTGDYWVLNEEGRVFFLQDYPYHTRNSVFVTYIAGNNRVPAAVHEAATKLVAAEIIRHDDQSILITETGANISTKEKYDILRKEAMDTLKGKSDIVYLI